jgi:hypothetical protein
MPFPLTFEVSRAKLRQYILSNRISFKGIVT